MSSDFLIAYDATAVKTPMSGVQYAVKEQVHALSSALPPSFSSILLARPDVHDLLPEILHFHSVPELLNAPLPRIIWQQFRLPSLLRKLHADMLYAFAYTAPLNCPVPYLLNVHDTIALEYPNLCSRRNALQMRLLLPASIRKARKCIVSTQHGADRLMQLLNVPHERIEVIHLGVDNQFFGMPSSHPPIQSAPYFLFVSNIEPKKDLDTLLDAYALSAEDTHAALVIVGRAAWKCSRTIQRLTHWNGPGHVQWLEYVPRAELPGLYQHALAFIMPSIIEGFGLPVLEAMAAGSPVIHSNHPALMEAAGNAGMAFPVGNARILSDCLKTICKAPKRRLEMIELGKSHAAQHSWTAWGETVSQVIQEVWNHC